uniref:Putative pol protein n=1 Tax=Porcine endogenous retrovirus TaxID=61673 RepID=A0A514C8X8_9GAMR|nr:putative pol protein [Porcine endogenous retrovirus]
MPITIPLKPNHPYPAQCQYLIPQYALKGLKPVITHLLQHGLLKRINSPYNFPHFTCPKTRQVLQIVQDLHLINQIVLPIHPVVPNPYTLLSSIPSFTTHYSVLDLKDAFFTIPLHPSSQPLFAFT